MDGYASFQVTSSASAPRTLRAGFLCRLRPCLGGQRGVATAAMGMATTYRQRLVARTANVTEGSAELIAH